MPFFRGHEALIHALAPAALSLSGTPVTSCLQIFLKIQSTWNSSKADAGEQHCHVIPF